MRKPRLRDLGRVARSPAESLISTPAQCCPDLGSVGLSLSAPQIKVSHATVLLNTTVLLWVKNKSSLKASAPGQRDPGGCGAQPRKQRQRLHCHDWASPPWVGPWSQKCRWSRHTDWPSGFLWSGPAGHQECYCQVLGSHPTTERKDQQRVVAQGCEGAPGTPGVSLPQSGLAPPAALEGWFPAAGKALHTEALRHLLLLHFLGRLLKHLGLSFLMGKMGMMSRPNSLGCSKQ